MNNWVFVSLEDLKDEKLTLRDYDIHTVYVSRRLWDSDLPDKTKLEYFMFMNSFRGMILDGNFVSSNIRRVNHIVRRNIPGEKEPFTVARKRLEGERV